jgi:hypothetical protein
MQTAPEIPAPATAPKAYKVTLRNGKVFIIGGMTITQLKFMRKNGGVLSLKQSVNGDEVNIDGKLIKHIEPFNPSQNGDSKAK